MEQWNVTSTKDNEKVQKLLGDLLNANKEFQIMITVPSKEMPAGRGKEIQVAAKLPEEKDLEQEVTALIHEIGVPAHI
ncbi:MAG: sporulation transcription factor Spo0A, partial [Lachnospiraceae bacterium]|nr:sporulation transcription factor Spo0A [Lachnospiraceae bacterium]